MNRFSSLVFAAILGSAITYGGVQYLAPASSHSSSFTTAPTVPVIKTSNSAAAVGVDFTAPAAVAMPTVVNIKATQGVMTANRGGQRGGQMSPFDFFFGDPYGEDNPFDQRGAQPNVATGSGVIISADGYIVTNNHVINDAEKLTVTLYDKRSYTATVIGTDPSTDIALIKIEEKGLPVLQFSDFRPVAGGRMGIGSGQSVQFVFYSHGGYHQCQRS